MKRFLGTIALATAAILLSLNLPGSHAVSVLRLDRSSAASIAHDDSQGALGLLGFAADTAIIEGTYRTTGQITNLTASPLSVNLTGDPLITQACSLSDIGLCSPTSWSLYMCLARDELSSGTTVCSPTAEELVFSGYSVSDPAPQTTGALVVQPGQTLYVMVRATLDGLGRVRLCGGSNFTLRADSGSDLSIQLAHSASAPRQQVYQRGSGC